MAFGVELIYCAAGNRRFAEIAINAGFTYGAQLPATVYFSPAFVDQDWKKTKCKAHKNTIDMMCVDCAQAREKARPRYMSSLSKHKPRLATVLDLEHDDQLPEVLAWAEEAAQYVTEAVLIIPKAQGIVSRLPRVIGGRSVRLAYSVPTKYGGSSLPLWDFTGWPVHLLGGRPEKQMELSHYLNVASADGNYFGMKAREFCEHWEWPGKWIPDGGRTENDAHYAAFERSCANIVAAWGRTIPKPCGL